MACEVFCFAFLDEYINFEKIRIELGYNMVNGSCLLKLQVSSTGNQKGESMMVCCLYHEHVN